MSQIEKQNKQIKPCKLNNCTYQLTIENLLKVRLAILASEPSGNVSLTIEELKPRVAKIEAGSSGISDIPETIRLKQSGDFKNINARLTILDATFSH